MGLSGEDAPGDERRTITDTVDLELDRLALVPDTNEIRVQGVRLVAELGREPGGEQSLGRDLTTIDLTPRVLGADGSEDVVTGRLEPEEFIEGDRRSHGG